jgi:uncharacterized protein with ParB-like and HNH nuclease domain
MDINPQKLTIGQLYSVSTEQFVVPEYQRPYAWSKPQYGALYEDLELLGDNDKHLFGMLIIHKQTFRKMAFINWKLLMDSNASPH